MKNLTNFERKSANSPNSKANFWVNLARNLKTLFTLPKWLKIFLSVLCVVLIAGVASVYALNFFTKDKIYSAEMTLHEQKIAKNNEGKEIGEFNYTARVHFPSLAPLLRSKTISKVYIVKFSWNEGLNSKEFTRLSNSGRNVFFSFTQDLDALGLENLGVVEYRVDFYPLLWSLLRYFVWIVACVGVFWVLWKMFIDLRSSLPPKNATLEPTRTLILTRKDYIFLTFAFLLCAGICAFTFWLGFPGYMADDLDPYRIYALIKDNWHPVFYSYVLQVLYFLFNKHAYYLFLFNLIPFYLGIFFLIVGFYIRFRSKFALFLLFPTFIGNFYLGNFTQSSYIVLGSLCFCLYFLLLFLILVSLNATKTQKIFSKILWLFLFILMLIAILSRHNAIFSVFPAFFVLCYIFLKDRRLNSKKFVKYYVILICLSAVLCVGIVKGVPKALSSGKSYPANHTFLHQIAGACVPADDSSCFKDEWYNEDKTFNDVKRIYKENLLDGDSFSCWRDMRFSCGKLDELYIYWFKSIVKHPYNYFKHELRFIKAMWLQNPKNDDFNDKIGFARSVVKPPHIIQRKPQLKPPYPDFYEDFFINFSVDEHSIIFNIKQEQIYVFLYDNLPTLNHLWGVFISFFIFIASIIILFKKFMRNTLLVFSFSAGFAGFFSAIFITGFSPVIWSRYMAPVLYLGIVAFLGFLAFILDCLSRKKGM